MCEVEEERADDSKVDDRPFGDALWSLLPILLFLLFALATYSNASIDGSYPLDFVVFHGAGQLFADGAFATAYDFDGLTGFLQAEYDMSFQESSVAHFLNPPPFGWAAQALGLLPIGQSFVVWSAFGVAITVACHLWLGLPRRALLLVLLSPMAVSTLSLGQTGALALLVTVAIHQVLCDERRRTAGVIAGLFILKPPLAIGYGLLWLIKWRSYGVAIVAALASGLVLSLPMAGDGLAPWRAFLETSLERSDLDSQISAGSSFSFAEFLKPILGDTPLEVTLAVWILGLLLGAALLIAVDRRTSGDVELLSAAASVVTVLFSPHILVYDSVLLIIPVAVAHRHGALDGQRVGVLGLLVSFGLTSRLLVGGPNVAFPSALIAAALLFWWIDHARGVADRSGLAVGPDATAVDGEREDLIIGEESVIN